MYVWQKSLELHSHEVEGRSPPQTKLTASEDPDLSKIEFYLWTRWVLHEDEVSSTCGGLYIHVDQVGSA